jgi:hypothetical protein
MKLIKSRQDETIEIIDDSDDESSSIVSTPVLLLSRLQWLTFILHLTVLYESYLFKRQSTRSFV